MNQTRKKDILRLIRNTKGRFLSLTAIIIIGVAFFVGVSGAGYVMGKNVDAYSDELNLKDITVYSDYGFDEEDVAAINALSEVDKAEGSKFVDVLATSEDASKVTRIHSYNEEDTINQFVLVEGRLPKNKNEVVAEKGTELSDTFLLDQTITLSRPDDDLSDYLSVTKVKVVGLVDTPLYINETKETSTLSNQYIATYLYIPEEAFCIDYDLEVNVLTKDGQSMYCFSDEYEAYCEEVKNDISDMGITQSKRRSDSIIAEAKEEYNQGLQEYNDGVKEYNEGIEDGEEKLEEAQSQLDDGKKELASGKQTLIDSQNELNEESEKSRQELDDSLTELEEKEAEANEGKEQLQAAKLQLESGIAQLEDARDSFAVSDTFFTTYETLEKGKTLIPAYEEKKIRELVENNQELKDFITAYGPSIKQAAAENGVTLPDDLQEMNANALNSVIGSIQEAMLSEVRSQLITQLSQYQSSLESAGISVQIPSANAGYEECKSSISSLQTGIQNKIDECNAQLIYVEEQMDEVNLGLAEIAAYKVQIESGYTQLDSTVASSQKQIDSGWKEINENAQTLSEAEAEIESGQDELEEQKKKGKKELQEAKEKLDKAAQDIEALETNSWTVIDRSSHYGMETYKSSVEQMQAIGNIFPVFFFLVSALVCLTTMTRMISEERGQIGILRALGYTTMQCAMKYVIYASSATLIGCVLGSILGTLSFPKIIYECWKMLYIEPDMKLYIPWHLIAAATFSFLAVMILTTLSVCYRSMKDVPSQLLRPESPKLGKSALVEKIGFVWHRLSFTWKVTIRNLARYKKRLIMTIIGVGGCSALMVIGFGIRDSLDQMVKLQFDEITHYDGFTKLSDDITDSECDSIIEKVRDHEDVSNVYSAVSYSGIISYGDEERTVLTQIFESDEDIEKLYTLRTRRGHKPISIETDGVVISEKLSEDLGVSIGDTITVESKYGVKKEVEISAITEMYIQHYCFMTNDTYKDLFSTDVEADTLFIMCDTDDSSALQSMLASDENITSISFYDVTLNNFNTQIKTMDYIIIVLIASSMALAFVVLGNLMNINISERQREIATLKVLGFRKREVQSYIYKENNILTVLGAIAGLPLGIALHHWIMHELQFSYVMYGVDVMPLSLLISVAMTVVFGLLVNQLMKKKLQQIDMIESLKSVE